MNRSNAIVIVLAVLGALAAIAAIWRATHGTQDDGPVAHVPDIPTVAVRYGTVDRTISVTGRAGTTSPSGAKLAFGIAGTIAQIGVAIGDRVSRGEELARIDIRPYQLAAQQAQAQAQAQSAAATAAGVDRTTSRLRADEADLSRQRTLYAAGVVARKDVQAAAAAVSADRADAQIARDQSTQAGATAAGATAQARSAQLDLERTSLRAPYDGTVAEVDATGGETVDASTPVLSVVPDGTSTGTLDVSFIQAAELKVGDALSLRAAGAIWNARVAAVGPAIQRDSGLATVRISNVPAGVVAGTPIDGRATLGSLRGLIVPIAAIVEDPESGDDLVFVRSASGKFNVRHVRIDGRDDRWARVVAGVREGERVASQGAIDLLQQ